MRTLRQPTRLLRVSVSKEIDTILPPEDALRRVSILAPTGETVLLGIDVDVISRNINEIRPEAPQRDGIGPNEHWRLAPLPTGSWARFCLAPGQWLVAAVEAGISTFPMIVEYPSEDDA